MKITPDMNSTQELRVVMGHKLIRTIAVVCLAGTTGFGQVAAIGDEINLASLVRPDAAVCLEGDSLRGLASNIRESKWFLQLTQTRFFAQWKASDDFRKFEQTLAQLEKLLEEPPRDFFEGLFGRRMILAIYSRPNESPSGILLFEAESIERLDRAISLWNRVENATTTELSYEGQSYFRRVRVDKADQASATIFYFRQGRRLAISDREILVQQAARSSSAKSPESLAGSTNYQAAYAKMPQGGSIRLFLQPQQWNFTSRRGDAGAGALPSWLQSWTLCTSVAVRLQFDEGWIVDAVALYPSDSSSERWKQFVRHGREAGPSPVHPPPEALAVWSSRFSLAELSQLIPTLIPQAKKKEAQRARHVARGLLLGHDPLDDVLPRLGPNFTGWIAAATSRKEDSAIPWEAAFQIALQPLPEHPKPADGVTAETKPQRSRPELWLAVDNAISTLFNLVAAGVNSQRENAEIVARDDLTAARRIRWIEGLTGWQPTISLSPTAIWFASSQNAMHESEARKDQTSSLTQLSKSLERCLQQPDHFVYLDIARIRQSLGAERAFLVRNTAGKSEEEQTVAGRRVEDVIDFLQLFDDLIVTVRIDEQEIRATAAVLHRAGGK